MRVVLLASGSGTLAQSIIDATNSGKLKIEILSLVSDQESGALIRATESGIKTKFLPMKADRALWDNDLHSYIENLNPDLVISVGFMRILAPDFVAKFPTVNTHPALLPNFPGAHAVRDALAAGATTSGSTVHWVDAGIDTGPIIAQREVSVLPGDDEESLHERIKIVERELIVETIQSFVLNGIPGRN
jgi:phosphoribosylglycinamide formyltransferase-1